MVAHIYAWTGIVTYAFLALRVTVMEPIPSGWREIRSLNTARVVDALYPGARVARSAQLCALSGSPMT